MCQSLFQYIPCYGLSPKVQQYIDRVESFQYIPCYGLSALGAGLREPPLYFNTSHVTVYQTEASKEFRSSHISIHPMLRFIDKYIKLFRGGMDFNTSHVTVYRFFSWHISPLKNYFNTSHVTVYPRKWLITINNPEFQYIPCYGLSCMA